MTHTTCLRRSHILLVALPVPHNTCKTDMQGMLSRGRPSNAATNEPATDRRLPSAAGANALKSKQKLGSKATRIPGGRLACR